MDQETLQQVAAAAERALQLRTSASVSDVLAVMGKAAIDRVQARVLLDRLAAQGAIVRLGQDLYGPLRARTGMLPGRSYVTDLARLTAVQLMVARA